MNKKKNQEGWRSEISRGRKLSPSEELNYQKYMHSGDPDNPDRCILNERPWHSLPPSRLRERLQEFREKEKFIEENNIEKSMDKVQKQWIIENNYLTK